ncbi:hypothetical protein FHS92_001613 [Sphingobium subterraneum]|uniref:Uncharacterized protein n=1 Tax=Sphingobium subterraneum TaxID=627688 RepID=A0A841IZN7_9SPHN|nr:hypothetical protein [Sphingobium subterraneum]
MENITGDNGQNLTLMMEIVGIFLSKNYVPSTAAPLTKPTALLSRTRHGGAGWKAGSITTQNAVSPRYGIYAIMATHR